MVSPAASGYPSLQNVSSDRSQISSADQNHVMCLIQSQNLGNFIIQILRIVPITLLTKPESRMYKTLLTILALMTLGSLSVEEGKSVI